VDVEPLIGDGDQALHFEFVDDVRGGRIPKELIVAVEQGVRSALSTGPVGGYPLEGVRFTLKDGSIHSKDSSEMSFRSVGAMALREAASRAQPVVTEPIMAVEVVVPTDCIGAVLGELSSRRGVIDALDDGPAGVAIIRARLPLAEMLEYSTA